jgi:hypothetical protein
MDTSVTALRDPYGGELADVLDWWAMLHNEPGILSTKTGRLQLTYDARFLDTEQMAYDERCWYLARLDEILKVLDEGWVLDSDWWHEPSAAYPQTDWDHVDAPRTARLVDSLRRMQCQEHPPHADQLYLTLSWRPPAPTRVALRNVFLSRSSAVLDAPLRGSIQAFHDGHEQLVTYLEPFIAHLRPLDADGLCTYLHQCVSWDRYAVRCPSPAYDLDWQLTSALWLPGRPPRLGGRLVQPLTIKSWHHEVRTLVPEALSKLPFPLRYHVRWAPKGLSTADQFLTWAEKKWATMYSSVGKIVKGVANVEETTAVVGRDDQEGAVTAGQDIIDLRRAVRQGRDVVGQLTPTVLVWSDTAADPADPVTLAQAQEEIKARVKAVSIALFQQGLVIREEQPNASIQWLASLPGHVRYGIRGRVLSVNHCTSLMPHHHAWNGPARDEHLDDEALMQLTTDGAPFRVVTSVGEQRSVLIAGPTRAGKSAWLGLSISQLFRYAEQHMALWDRDFSLKCVTLTHGGLHYNPGQEGSPRLQPLAHLDSNDERLRKAIWLDDLLTNEGLSPDAEERGEILRMLRTLADVPPHYRTMTMAARLLQAPRLKIGLAPFCEGGDYAFFDGNEDPFDWETRLLCFEMKWLINYPRAFQAFTSYAFQELDARWMTGAFPTTIIMDELKWLLEFPVLVKYFELVLLARAKFGVALWAAIQDLVYLKRSPVWQAILANMPTKFLLPNSNATSKDVYSFYEDIGVTDQAIRQLASAVPRRDILYTSPLGTRMLQNTLEPAVRIQVAASRPHELRALDTLAAQVARADFPAAWLAHWGYHDLAATLAPPDEKGEPCIAPSLPSDLASPLVLAAPSSHNGSPSRW